MDEQKMIEEMAGILESNGEITLHSYDENLFIQSVDDKEGYSYVSSTNEEFESSREAVEWAVEHFYGVENIEDWQ